MISMPPSSFAASIAPSRHASKYELPRFFTTMAMRLSAANAGRVNDSGNTDPMLPAASTFSIWRRFEELVMAFLPLFGPVPFSDRAARKERLGRPASIPHGHASIRVAPTCDLRIGAWEESVNAHSLPSLPEGSAICLMLDPRQRARRLA